MGSGNIILTPTMTLKSALYVPSFPINLISVRKLMHTLHCIVTFSSPFVYIQDSKTKAMIGTGRESHGGHYILTGIPTALTTSGDILRTHCQLGHPGLPSLRQMRPSLSHISSLECESCHLGKHHRISFPVSHKRASAPFVLVHSDVWGPTRVPSTFGFRYFVTFIDDFSRVTWLFLMKDRSELFTIFKIFCAEVKTQFQTVVCILRSDNAKEYFSQAFQSFMSDQGMLHQSSCPHTPQQNGLAERKNRHLVETVRTLLLHMHVPLSYWGDAMLTSCYLINRMPSSSIGNQVSFSILFPSESRYSVPPRVFGCTCFVHILSQGQDKLSPKAHRCLSWVFPHSERLSLLFSYP